MPIPPQKNPKHTKPLRQELRTNATPAEKLLWQYLKEKQISNYIFKLNKEIKKLPYEFGAEFGFSMIQDDIKTIEDALNEAVEDMKKNKENSSNE